jgi:4-amino-4-deoxy-L-arabinose transferase-like glycosyltransferase
MLSVSLFVELLRTRPRQMFWTAVLVQAALWTLIPALFYSAPPGQLAEVLAVGHEWQFGSDYGPPLAYWIANIAYAVAGMFGVYLVSQVCIVVTGYAVFTLGRAIVGAPQAAIAAMLMVGISVFTVPSPDFGPNILATALWALVLAHYWLAFGAGRPSYWYAVGIEIGLLILTAYAGLILALLLFAYTLATRRGRERMMTVYPWIAGVLILLIVFPHLIWLEQTGSATLINPTVIEQNLRTWGGIVMSLAVAHAGFIVLVAIAHGLSWSPRGQVAQIERKPVDSQARLFVYFFALAPAAVIGLYAFVTNRPDSFIATPLVVLSGLAIVVALPDKLRIAQQRLTAAAWVGLLIAPPAIVALGVAVMPWIYPIDLRIAQPAGEMGRFFAENFQRRTGRPLEIAGGDPRLASLVALTAPVRPSLFLQATPERTPWVSAKDIDEKGAVVVWPATDTRGLPPASIREQFPNVVPEVPRAFERRFQGRLPLIRIGWAVIRPRAQVAPPAR